MRELKQHMTNCVDDTVLKEYGEISTHFEVRGGYDIDLRTDEVLANLRVGYLTRDRKVSGLSGGEKARVGLAVLLLAVEPRRIMISARTTSVALRRSGQSAETFGLSTRSWSVSRPISSNLPKLLRFRARFSGGRLRPGTVAVEAHGLVMRYGERTVLDRVDCLLEADDRVCLIGPNGSGKSTLMRILAREAEPQAGDLRWVPGVRIGYLPQEPNLPEPAATVAANITLGLRRAGLPSVTDEARGWLVRWGLLTREDLTKRVADLSVGQQRKVELGILVGSGPDVLLLDEPTNHVTFDVIEFVASRPHRLRRSGADRHSRQASHPGVPPAALAPEPGPPGGSGA
ncbi:MAG: ATP-binding cassette domain-containing protein [Pseudonocardiaceae bacterium]